MLTLRERHARIQEIAKVYSNMVGLRGARQGYDVLGRTPLKSRHWDRFEKLTDWLDGEGIDPEDYFRAQFEFCQGMPYPYPNTIGTDLSKDKYGWWLERVERRSAVWAPNVQTDAVMARAIDGLRNSAERYRRLAPFAKSLEPLALYRMMAAQFTGLFMLLDPELGGRVDKELAHFDKIEEAKLFLRQAPERREILAQARREFMDAQ